MTLNFASALLYGVRKGTGMVTAVVEDDVEAEGNLELIRTLAADRGCCGQRDAFSQSAGEQCDQLAPSLPFQVTDGI